ncbi:MAG: SGNH/GDSL hydrolase family protein [Acidobacteriota bacterium]
MSASPLPLWKKLLFSLLATGLFFGGLELLLAGLGIEPVLYESDPYVGFASAVSHFVSTQRADGSEVLETAVNKRRLFNVQSFARFKPEGTYRIFCLGGSTTYGRPYGDGTSFCGWLREFLPVADPSRTWEVVNAGGISYASYRVALLMEELLRYEPDLFIVYSGHNEFLEQRTYGEILAYPRALRGLGALASRTRLFTAGQQALARARSREGSAPATELGDEVRTLLDASVGPSAYHRDEALQGKVLQHFRFSLTRMVEMARSAGAEILLINPASNLRHCSPFKSEPGDGLSEASRPDWEERFAAAGQAVSASRWQEALAALDEAAALDDRHAELHFHRGRALDALGRHEAAKLAFERARDEDVCPLRALGPTSRIVADVAHRGAVPMVDFASMVEERSPQGIAGEDLFLDHVHPTIEGHRLLALEILQILEREGVVRPVADWGEGSIRRVQQAVEDQIDPAAHGMALSQLSRVLGWAGKLEEARKLAIRSTELAPNLAPVQHQAALSAHLTGHLDEAILHYRHTLELDPRTATAHSNLAVILDDAGEVTEAARHYRHAIALLSDKNAAYRQRLREKLAALEARRGV